MAHIACSLYLSILLTFLFAFTSGKYEPTWESIDTRPLPDWYDEVKLGIFIHWGVYSVPSFGSEWSWWNWKQNLSQPLIQFINNTYPKGISYQDFAKDFTAELFDPQKWAKIIHSSGAKYVVFTSKHHDGYATWPSKYSFSWNSMDVGPHRDLVGEIKKSLETYPDIKFGLYHSLYEWFNPLYLADKANNFTNLDKVNFVDSKILPEMIDLIKTYRPYVLWSDGEWEAESSYWKSTEFLAWLYNESPVKDYIVTNDRWGKETLCKHGGYLTCNDRFNPGTLQTRKWENAMTIDKLSWGYRRVASLSDYLSMNEIVQNLTSTVSCGGNLLLNVGPTKDGIISPIYEERLYNLGSWMKVNGEAIYKSRSWTVCRNDSLTPGVWYTTNKDKTILYAMFSPWPVDNLIKLKCPKLSLSSSTVEMLGVPGKLEHMITEQLIQVRLPDKSRVVNDWVWTLKMDKVKNVDEDFKTAQMRDFEDGISILKTDKNNIVT